MPTFRQIYFGPLPLIEQRTDALDDIEAHIGMSRTQPS